MKVPRAEVFKAPEAAIVERNAILCLWLKLLNIQMFFFWPLSHCVDIAPPVLHKNGLSSQDHKRRILILEPKGARLEIRPRRLRPPAIIAVQIVLPNIPISLNTGLEKRGVNTTNRQGPAQLGSKSLNTEEPNINAVWKT